MEALIRKLGAQDIPADTISAQIVTLLANPDRNLITVSGAGHLSGLFQPDDGNQGVFDEALARHWRVSDALIGDSADIAYLTDWYSYDRESIIANNCRSYDHIDAVIDLDADIVVRPPAIPNPHATDLPQGLPRDIFSCLDSPPVDEVYRDTPHHLDPSQIPELAEAIRQARAALAGGADDAPGTIPTDAQPHRSSSYSLPR